MVFVSKWQSYKSPYKDTRGTCLCYLMHHAGGEQPSCLCFSVLFFLFAFLPSRVRHGAARLSWHGGKTDYVCACVRVRAVSQSTSLRIDYYSSSLGVTEKATKTPSCTAWRCCCVRVNFVMWPEACLLQSDGHLCDGSVSSCLSYLLPVSDTGGDLGCTNIPAS